MLKKILVILVFIILILFAWNFRLVVYAVGQGIGQFKILISARPIEEILKDPLVSGDVRDKLHLIQEIKKFSINELGLNNTKNYTTLYEQNGKPVLWIVRACERFRLVNKEWYFPIVGRVSYKGYFNLEKAKKLRDQLKDDGYDTYIREVNAWSTLGWFKDPIMSEMLKEPPGALANTIIHELTHSTIFVKDSLTYNENIASFVGDKGAIEFLKYSDGEESKEYLKYVNAKVDREKYSNHFVNGARVLDSLYNSFTDKLSIDQKKELKTRTIQKIVNRLDTIAFVNPALRNRFSKVLPNNAYFMSYMLYRSEQSDLESTFLKIYRSDLKKMIESLKKKHPSN